MFPTSGRRQRGSYFRSILPGSWIAVRHDMLANARRSVLTLFIDHREDTVLALTE